MTYGITSTDLVAEKARLSAKMVELENEMRAIRIEIADVESALRVAKRLEGRGTEGVSEEKKGNTGNLSIIKWSDLRPVTMPDMVTEALRSAPGGLKPAAVVEFIQEYLKPGTRADEVRPTLWHMWKKGRLDKDEKAGTYRLPKDKGLDLDNEASPSLDLLLRKGGDGQD